MREMRVICARYNQEAKRIEVVREIVNDDMTIEYNGLSIPPQRMEWLSAEYEINDEDELAEFAIYESIMPRDDDHPNATMARQQKRERLAAAKVALGPMTPTDDPQTLKNRLQAAGFPDEYINAVDNNPIQVIKQRSPIDQVRVREKRDLIRARRAGLAAPDLPSPRAPKSDELRARNTSIRERALPRINMVGGQRVRSQTDG